MTENPKDRGNNEARVYSLDEHRKKREAPLQAAKNRHPAFLAAARRKEQEEKGE